MASCLLATAAGPAQAQPAGCSADCNGNAMVTIDELILAVGVALGLAPADRCAAADASGDGTVSIDELILAVERSLTGCAGTVSPSPTAATTSSIASATPTITPTSTPAAIPTVTFTPTFAQPVTVLGACRIPAAVRRQPAVPCPAGTLITTSRCDDRDRCTSDAAARTRLAETGVAEGGRFEMQMDGARAAGRLLHMQAEVADAVVFQMMDLGLVNQPSTSSPTGQAGGVLQVEVDIDASSEAALRELTARGLDNFSDQDITSLIASTRDEAVGGEVYGGLAADAAAERGRLIAASALEPVAIAVSPDGAHVYAANGFTDSITAYRRIAGGALEPVETYTDGVGGVEGLDGAFDVAVNPSASHVYAVGRYDNAVVVFSRDAQTGRLTSRQVIDSVIVTVNNMPRELLDVPYSVEVSPDDGFVYVRDLGRAGFLIEFTRSPTTGRLSFNLSRDVAVQPRGFEGKRQLSRFAASDDAGNVYIEYNDGDGILTLQRGPDGLLFAPNNPVHELRSADGVGCDVPGPIDCQTLSPGLNSVTGFAALQQHLYVASVDDRALNVFSRNTANRGRLTRVALYQQDVDGVDGLDGPIGITVTSDGRHLYAAAFEGNSVAAFARSATTGELTFVQALRDDDGGVDGLGGAFDVAASPDGVNVYVVSSRDTGVATFARDVESGALTFLGVSE